MKNYESNRKDFEKIKANVERAIERNTEILLLFYNVTKL